MKDRYRALIIILCCVTCFMCGVMLGWTLFAPVIKETPRFGSTLPYIRL